MKTISKKIAIIGCGQVGSRHLQAMAKLCENHALKVQVVDLSLNAEEIGKKRLREVLTAPEKLEIEWLRDVSSVDADVDLTIVSTTSNGRVALIDELLHFGHRCFLVEKMVCQNINQYDHLLESLNRHQARAWVNCPFRYFKFYQEMANSLEGDKIVFSTAAGNYGLGCNAIHYLDLFVYFSHLDPSLLKLEGSQMFRSILPNKRGKEFVEFSGTITASLGECFASVSFLPDHRAPGMISCTASNLRFWVDESQKEAMVALEKDEWLWRKREYRFPHTSEVTSLVVQDIFKHNRCLLPSLTESYPIHKELFRIFNHHLQEIKGELIDICPIT